MNELDRKAAKNASAALDQLLASHKDDCQCHACAARSGLAERIAADDPNDELIARLTEALREYQIYNPLHNDLDAYLFASGQRALGEERDKPIAGDYGVNHDR